MTKQKDRYFLLWGSILAILIVGVFVERSVAEMYKWVDERGVTHFSDLPPESQEPASEVESISTYDYRPKKVSKPRPSKAEEPQVTEAKETKPAPRAEAITWHEYGEGLNRARSTRKPAIIIFYTQWCPTCKKYWNAFNDTSVIAESSKFIMIRVDDEKSPDLSKKYAFDGGYIPRTFAVYPNGEVMHEIYPSRKHKYYIGTGVSSLLKLMKSAGKAAKGT
jgi:thiol-disulfide isomerase/thioredoxin